MTDYVIRFKEMSSYVLDNLSGDLGQCVVLHTLFIRYLYCRDIKDNPQVSQHLKIISYVILCCLFVNRDFDVRDFIKSKLLKTYYTAIKKIKEKEITG